MFQTVKPVKMCNVSNQTYHITCHSQKIPTHSSLSLVAGASVGRLPDNCLVPDTCQNLPGTLVSPGCAHSW